MSAFHLLISYSWDYSHSSSSPSQKSKGYSFLNFLSLLWFVMEGRKEPLLFTGAYLKSSYSGGVGVLSIPSSNVCNQNPASVPLCSFSTSYTRAIETEHSATVTITLKNKFSLLKCSFPRSHQAGIHTYI